MKIVTVVGARPQFIKAAAGSRQIRKEHTELLVHTGQHFDENMSEVFFREMKIPKPDYNLGISGGTHSRMTASMMVGIENILLEEAPDATLVYGDTNSEFFLLNKKGEGSKRCEPSYEEYDPLVWDICFDKDYTLCEKKTCKVSPYDDITVIRSLVERHFPAHRPDCP